MAARYRLCLPKTKFPLRINPATHEPAIQKAAKFNELYHWQQKERANTEKTFTLHDGPPYANGRPHMGHVLNKVLKDIVNRYKLMRGYRIDFRPGWDCHGLPIELKAVKEADVRQAHPLTIRAKAAKFAQKALKAQRESFKRWGCLGDWDNPYVTMDPLYEANQIHVFRQMYQRGCIYRGFKPVYWSPSSGTALAEAELEYQNHTSRAVHVLFPILHLPGEENRSNLHALVWTTTPWTLVANRAICYNPEHQYSLIKVTDEGGSPSFILVGKEALQSQTMKEVMGRSNYANYEVVSTFSGRKLEGAKYSQLLSEEEGGGVSKEMLFLPAEHVAEKEGTGLVHTAPSHGFEDYSIGVRYGLDLQCCVNDQGRYTVEAGTALQDLPVLTEGNDTVILKLKQAGRLLHEHAYTHRYPYDWRTKQPVIIRSTEQWFASVKDLKEEAKACLENIRMYPPSSVDVLRGMLDTRDDWCISRQRVWGVPLPVFYHRETGEALINDETLSHVEGLVCSHGTDCWWKLPVGDLLPPTLRPVADEYVKGRDTMDVWFDSGSSWATVLAGGVADMYLEGTDQHRGWFQSSLLTSIAAQGKAPYKSVITHGFVLDGDGAKMSKSVGNVMSPDDIIESKNYGADVMRLWVASSSFTSAVPVSDGILQQTNDILQKIRNTCRFILGNLSDFDPRTQLRPYESLSKLDRYMLHVLHSLSIQAIRTYDNLNYSRFYHALVNTVPTDFSSFYFSVIKDRLYCDPEDSEQRRSTQTALHHLLKGFTSSIAPILPHLAEEIALHYPFENGTCNYVNLVPLME